MSEKKSKKLVPQLRFKGFTDDWEQCELGGVATYVVEKNVARAYSETLTNSAEYGVISQREFFDKEISNVDNSDKYTVIQPDDFIYNPRISNLAPFGPIRRNHLNRTGIVSPLYSVFRIYGGVLSFAEWYFLSNKWNRFIYRVGDTGARYDRVAISNATFMKLPMPITSRSEENLIGKFFETLDSLIVAHERKLELLKKKKTYYLQQIFSQKLRFKGFSEPWKQCKLYSLLEERNTLESPSEEHPLVSFTVDNGVTPKSERYDRSFLVRTSEKQYKYTKVDDIVYNPANLKFGAIARNSFGDAVFSPIYVTFEIKDPSIPHFIEYLVTKKSFITKALTYQEGTVYERMAVKPKDFLQLKVSIPCSKEQKKIAQFLESLDFLMAAHEKKLNLLKKQKQAYLQKMFV